MTPDVIRFTHELEVGMSVAFGTGANVRECLEVFEIIASDRFEQLPASWRKYASRSVAYHPGLTGAGVDFVYYDPW